VLKGSHTDRILDSILAPCIRSRWVSVVCLAVVALALALPPDGLGLPLCQFRAITGIPCLGCGLTRSFIGMAHLDVMRAGFYNPAGVALFPLICFLAALLPSPAARRERIARWVEGRAVLWNWIGGLVIAVFIINGFARVWWVLTSGRPSPW